MFNQLKKELLKEIDFALFPNLAKDLEPWIDRAVLRGMEKILRPWERKRTVAKPKESGSVRAIRAEMKATVLDMLNAMMEEAKNVTATTTTPEPVITTITADPIDKYMNDIRRQEGEKEDTEKVDNFMNGLWYVEQERRRILLDEQSNDIKPNGYRVIHRSRRSVDGEEDFDNDADAIKEVLEELVASDYVDPETKVLLSDLLEDVARLDEPEGDPWQVEQNEAEAIKELLEELIQENIVDPETEIVLKDLLLAETYRELSNQSNDDDDDILKDFMDSEGTPDDDIYEGSDEIAEAADVIEFMKDLMKANDAQPGETEEFFSNQESFAEIPEAEKPGFMKFVKDLMEPVPDYQAREERIEAEEGEEHLDEEEDFIEDQFDEISESEAADVMEFMNDLQQKSEEDAFLEEAEREYKLDQKAAQNRPFYKVSDEELYEAGNADVGLFLRPFDDPSFQNQNITGEPEDFEQENVEGDAFTDEEVPEIKEQNIGSNRREEEARLAASVQAKLAAYRATESDSADPTTKLVLESFEADLSDLIDPISHPESLKMQEIKAAQAVLEELVAADINAVEPIIYEQINTGAEVFNDADGETRQEMELIASGKLLDGLEELESDLDRGKSLDHDDETKEAQEAREQIEIPSYFMTKELREDYVQAEEEESENHRRNKMIVMEKKKEASDPDEKFLLFTFSNGTSKLSLPDNIIQEEVVRRLIKKNPDLAVTKAEFEQLKAKELKELEEKMKAEELKQLEEQRKAEEKFLLFTFPNGTQGLSMPKTPLQQKIASRILKNHPDLAKTRTEFEQLKVEELKQLEEQRKAEELEKELRKQLEHQQRKTVENEKAIAALLEEVSRKSAQFNEDVIDPVTQKFLRTYVNNDAEPEFEFNLAYMKEEYRWQLHQLGVYLDTLPQAAIPGWKALKMIEMRALFERNESRLVELMREKRDKTFDIEAVIRELDAEQQEGQNPTVKDASLTIGVLLSVPQVLQLLRAAIQGEAGRLYIERERLAVMLRSLERKEMQQREIEIPLTMEEIDRFAEYLESTGDPQQEFNAYADLFFNSVNSFTTNVGSAPDGVDPKTALESLRRTNRR